MSWSRDHMTAVSAQSARSARSETTDITATAATATTLLSFCSQSMRFSKIISIRQFANLFIKLPHGLTETQRKTLGSGSGPHSIVSWSPDGELVASATMDNVVKVWNTCTEHILREIPHSDESLNAIAITNDVVKVAWSSEKDSTGQTLR